MRSGRTCFPRQAIFAECSSEQVHLYARSSDSPHSIHPMTPGYGNAVLTQRPGDDFGRFFHVFRIRYRMYRHFGEIQVSFKVLRNKILAIHGDGDGMGRVAVQQGAGAGVLPVYFEMQSRIQ